MLRTILAYILALIILTACASQAEATPLDSLTLSPYGTQTRSPLQTPEGLVAAETPLPTPTPFTYTVKAGDTISSIALEFGVSMDDLQAANPQVSPNTMSIGTTLQIPSNPNNPSGEPTPTPAPFDVQQIECYPTINRGMWCFVLVHNDSAVFMENISAQVTLVDESRSSLNSRTAFLPLNILPPTTSLPLLVYFPPDIPFTAKPQVQILTGIQLLPNDTRYLPATIHDTLVEIDEDGHYARINGEVRLPEGSRSASQVWVAAVAYDDNGRVVGVKRWEGGAIQPGGSINFEMFVASVGGRMTRVEFAVEARP